jgi:hypothetical protein
MGEPPYNRCIRWQGGRPEKPQTGSEYLLRGIAYQAAVVRSALVNCCSLELGDNIVLKGVFKILNLPVRLVDIILETCLLYLLTIYLTVSVLLPRNLPSSSLQLRLRCFVSLHSASIHFKCLPS